MSQLIYSPFGALNQLHRELNRVFDERTSSEPAAYEQTAWVPHVDISEDDAGFNVSVDVPGVDPKDVDITLDRSLLTIKGSRDTSVESEEGGFKRRERTTGRFVRQFTLPETVDDSAIKARVDNGVLKISIPKGQAAKPRSITVEA